MLIDKKVLDELTEKAKAMIWFMVHDPIRVQDS